MLTISAHHFSCGVLCRGVVNKHPDKSIQAVLVLIFLQSGF